MKKHRMSLEFSDKVKKRLDALVEYTEAPSMTQVIVNALAVYELLITEQSRGGKVVIKNGKKEREVILIT